MKTNITLVILLIMSISLLGQGDSLNWEYIYDTIEENNTHLSNYPVIDAHMQLYSSDSYWNAGSSQNGIPRPASVDEHYQAVLNEFSKNNIVFGLAHSRQSTCIDYFDNYPENRDKFKFGISLYDFSYSHSNNWYYFGHDDLEQDIIDGKISFIGELLGIYWNKPYYDSIYLELFELADKYGLQANVHTGIPPFVVNNPDWNDYSYYYANPATLDTLLKLYPNINICAAHWGISAHPDYNFEDDVITSLKEFNNLYIDISATSWFGADGIQATTNFLKKLIQEGLENKILYGSDEMVYPGAISKSVNYVKNADFLTAVQKKKILFWNSVKYLRLNYVPTTSIYNHLIKTDILYPNPTKGFIYIFNPYLFQSIEIYSLYGQCLVKSETNQIDISAFPSGIYVVKILHKNGTSYSQNMIKQ